eukprot:1150250-Pelagomonas_calceolata.AAC.1
MELPVLQKQLGKGMGLTGHGTPVKLHLGHHSGYDDVVLNTNKLNTVWLSCIQSSSLHKAFPEAVIS